MSKKKNTHARRKKRRKEARTYSDGDLVVVQDERSVGASEFRNFVGHCGEKKKNRCGWVCGVFF
jgi:hypothetical protein